MDNDHAKTAGEDYVNVKPVEPVYVCIATMLQKLKSFVLFYYMIYIYIYLYMK